MPPEIQAAADAGDLDAVTKLLISAPADMSKSTKKKLLKQAEIMAKKLAKGGAAPKPRPTGAPAAPKKVAAAAAAAAAAAPTPTPTGSAAPQSSAGGVVGDAERAIVEDVLACLEGLAVPADTLELLKSHRAAIGLAIRPGVNASRNEAYTSGFGAAASVGTRFGK